ncbi:MAG: NAD(+) diphosphatase, partial [Pseudomonadota bacterium]
MKDAETVMFGGSGLNRAAELRGDVARIDEMLETGGVLPLWRGKPLLEVETRQPVFLPSDHPAFQVASEPPVFLGIDGRTPRFARDISAFQPGSDTETVGQFTDPSEQRHPDVADTQVFAELRANMVHLAPRAAELVASGKALIEWHRTHRFCAQCGGASNMIEAGWQRACPACGARHFPRTDPVVIMLITRGNSVLMGRSPHWPEGMYSLLAGFVEPGETIEAAVRREVFEEAGIKVGEVRYLASQPWPFPNSLMFGCEGIAV